MAPLPFCTANVQQIESRNGKACAARHTLDRSEGVCEGVNSARSKMVVAIKVPTCGWWDTMPSGNSKFRLLVKTAPGPAAVQLSLNGQRFGFSMTSLQVAQRRGVARTVRWHALTPAPSPGLAEDWGTTNAWDMCHELVSGGLGVDGGSQVEFAEPDLQQQWLVGRPGAMGTKLGLNGPTPDLQNSGSSCSRTKSCRHFAEQAATCRPSRRRKLANRLQALELQRFRRAEALLLVRARVKRGECP
jgi:hypothetical protein